jgi:uncharacterized protein involved in copper resistance
MAGQIDAGARRKACAGAVAGACALAAALTGPVAAEPLIWGVQAEQFEYRFGEDADALAWEADAFVGTDAAKLRYQGEGEFDLEEDSLEAWENRLVVQVPVSPFFDAKAGVRYDAPDGPDPAMVRGRSRRLPLREGRSVGASRRRIRGADHQPDHPDPEH